MKQDNSLSKDMKMMVLKFYILGSISESSKANPYALIKKIGSCKSSEHLFESKTEIKDGIYNAVSCLEHSGYIRASQKIESGRLKKYYALTKEGKESLKSTKKLFSKSVLEMAAVIGK